ncbi:hypothetical protein ABNF97_18415 [Plantactinospora sp. B6F1]|uniref:hypothetical protein n=1 Tax=Plantactinospora sp. B6F1 TaxID=3158971 RepID=UPI0032D973B5
MSTTIKAYDSADSPGPITSVLERFRPRPAGEAPSLGAEAEAARYTVLLVPPDQAEALGHAREDAGLKLYLDSEYDYDVANLYEAAKLIEEECGAPVTLVEHRADLTYWTARLRQSA